MKIKIEEMVRATEDDQVELEGKVFRANDPNEGEYGWSQFIVVKDDTAEQGCWLKLDGEEDKVSKGSTISLKGKVGKEYTDKRGKKARSVNNCEFSVKSSDTKDIQETETTNGTKDNYWEKKFKYEVQRDPKIQLFIVRQCAIKAATELATSLSKSFPIKTEKEYFDCADKIEAHIYRDLMIDESVAILGGEIIGTQEDGTPNVETKEARIEKARETVKNIQENESGETRFRPASTLQKNKIFGYRDEKGWHKGIIESRYIEKDEIRKIGDPKKLSVEKANEWMIFWWGDITDQDDIGARKQREIDNPRDENGKPINALVKGDKTSLTKDVLIDKVNALRRENFLVDDEKFKKEMGYNPNLVELTEAELTKLKEILEHYNPL